MTKRQRRAIWKKAAERIASGEAYYVDRDALKRELLPDFNEMFDQYQGDTYFGDIHISENQLARQIALLLMREMEE